MATDLSLLLFLIVLNGVFAMSEIAIVGSKRARLPQMAETGSAGARHALTLSSEPTRFLSSVQVGITCIGITRPGCDPPRQAIRTECARLAV